MHELSDEMRESRLGMSVNDTRYDQLQGFISAKFSGNHRTVEISRNNSRFVLMTNKPAESHLNELDSADSFPPAVPHLHSNIRPCHHGYMQFLCRISLF